MINIIACVDLDFGIARDGDIPWHLPDDLRYFREKTEGSFVVMGSTTYKSLRKPLPNRTNIVLSRENNFNDEGVLTYSSIEPILILAKSVDVWIIGGEDIYSLFLPHAQRIYLTNILETFDCDKFFPAGNYLNEKFRIKSVTLGVIDDKNKHEHIFFEFERINDRGCRHVSI
ncbi:dihydrofolate reductase [Bacillus paralicheniformis]|uniref:dihydrofolate reductase n=1 Tax=Bacillus paralicheniformis TaxID=1648923 RepID=UPI003D22571A